MGIPWDGMGWDKHNLLWERKGTEKYVPWTSLLTNRAKTFLYSLLIFSREIHFKVLSSAWRSWQGVLISVISLNNN